MTKALSIILLICVIGSGIYFSKNYMNDGVSEGTPIGYGQDKKGEKSEKKSFTVTFPKVDSKLRVGEKVNVTWNSISMNLNLKYSVSLVNIDNQTKVELGTAKYSLFNRVFVWNIATSTIPGNYKIVFGGPKGGESSVFQILSALTPPTTVNNPGPAVFSKASSNISTLKTNNVDMGVTARFIVNIQANGSDIYASGTSAVVLLKDVATGKIITEKTVSVVPMESGTMYFADGATKPISIDATFPASIFPIGATNVKASIYSINYTTVGNPVKPSATYTALDFGLYDTNFTTIFVSEAAIPSFTRDLTVGSSGADVTRLQNILLAKGYSTIDSTGYFGPTTKAAVAAYQASIGISPADGYVGALTRARLNLE